LEVDTQAVHFDLVALVVFVGLVVFVALVVAAALNATTALVVITAHVAVTALDGLAELDCFALGGDPFCPHFITLASMRISLNSNRCTRGNRCFC